MTNKNIKEEMGIDLPKLKRWIKKNIGEDCKEERSGKFEFGCFVCRSLLLYDDIEGFIKLMKKLEKYD